MDAIEERPAIELDRGRDVAAIESNRERMRVGADVTGDDEVMSARVDPIAADGFS